MRAENAREVWTAKVDNDGDDPTVPSTVPPSPSTAGRGNEKKAVGIFDDQPQIVKVGDARKRLYLSRWQARLLSETLRAVELPSLKAVTLESLYFYFLKYSRYTEPDSLTQSFFAFLAISLMEFAISQ
jgi:hypothetical protein